MQDVLQQPVAWRGMLHGDEGLQADTQQCRAAAGAACEALQSVSSNCVLLMTSRHLLPACCAKAGVTTLTHSLNLQHKITCQQLQHFQLIDTFVLKSSKQLLPACCVMSGTANTHAALPPATSFSLH